ncbi:type 1 glutamine amidotransferase domain-containing protein [soil metagenome]
MNEINKLTIAILSTDGFEEVELSDPRNAMKEAGIITHIVAPNKTHIRAWDKTKWSKEYPVDVPLEEADSKNYHGLMLPGGVMNPDKLRMNDQAIQFIGEFIRDKKPIAAICHGPQLLIETGELKGRKLTSYPSIKTDLINAGAEWVDKEVVVENGWVTSRKPEDIPAFNKAMIEEFRQVLQKELAE